MQTLDGAEGGALTTSTGRRQVVVSVPSAQAGQVLAAIAGKDLSLAILDDLTVAEGRPTVGPSQSLAPTAEPTGSPDPTRSPDPTATAGPAAPTTG